MATNTIQRFAGALATACLVTAGLGGSVNADDTEIYRATATTTSATARPKVLIVFDNSGSMAWDVVGKPKYNPSATYVSKFDTSRIYWNTTGRPEDFGAGTNKYFAADKNRCDESYDPLDDEGWYISKVRSWNPTKRSGKGNWVSLPKGAAAAGIIHVDCEADVINDNDENGSGVSDGFPYRPNAAHSGEPYWASTVAESVASRVNWGKSAINLYTGHYLNYMHDETLADVNRPRLEIAQEAVTSLVNANNAIDFGLAVFNYNYPTDTFDGGRVARRIISDMSYLERGELVTLIGDQTARGSTPLCEATYEAYRYIAGENVLWGHSTEGGDSTPPFDAAAESGGSYISPSTDCAYTYVIVMTDGMPQYDTHANGYIKTLTGETCDEYVDANGDMTENCMPQLAQYMANTDLDGDSTNGEQFGITYTIGFTTDQDLLKDTADQGKGKYYTASSSKALNTAFRGAILGIMSTETTFTSPAVAVDTFTRTQSRNEIFYAMFEPDDRLDWPGNIKRLTLSIVDGVATLVDADGDPAIDVASAQIKTDARTAWSTSDDGPKVEAGGVGALLAARTPSTRALYTNAGVDLSDAPTDELVALDSDNITAAAYGFASEDELYSFYDVADEDELEELIYWAAGYTIADDGSAVDTSRGWLLSDMLHSQPLVLNYGARSPFTLAEPDLRILVGTNGGFLHMFHNEGTDAGEEAWAFFAKELGPILDLRRTNEASSDHAYGIDSPVVSYTHDLNRDGTIDSTVGDKAYVYFGLRRGGRILYALDVSNPDSPDFLWKIDHTTTGFSELGQTWSVPVVTRIPGYVDGSGVPKPVLVFGAGYDTEKDGPGLVSDTTDTVGRGIFIVDATTGALIWSITPALDSATNMQETGLVHSVVGGVTPLDSNGDELSDRFYFADTGGNVWRVDLPGNTRPTSSQDTWRIVKLAELNGGTAATDRRFFNAPDVASTRYEGYAFDAVMIGSGDRTNPNATDVDNQFYMIRDEQVTPYFAAEPTSSECDGPPPLDDFRCNLPLDPNDLFDATDNIIDLGTDAEKATALIDLSTANGWRLDLTADGEKSLARSLTIGGSVFFTTFSPEATVLSLCKPTPGDGRLYIVNLFRATPKDTDRSKIIGSLIPDTPSPHFGPGSDGGGDGEIRLLLPGLPPIDSGSSLPDPYGSYWYREEY